MLKDGMNGQIKMATGRMLKKNISKSEKFAALKSDRARLLYLLILPHLDRAGRLDANPKLIKGQITPLLSMSIAIIQTCLEDMHNVGLVSLYCINDAQYLEYTKFTDFQTLRDDREAESEIPSAPAELPRDSGGTAAEVKLSKVKLSKDKRKGFAPPSLSEIQIYIKKQGYKFVKAESFFNFYESKGWMVGKNKMKDWRKAIAGWEAREKDKHPATKSASPLQVVVCIVDHKPARDYRMNGRGRPIWLCVDCCRAMGNQDWGKMSKPEIERAVEEGKRRPPPERKDPELAKQDRVQAQVQKLADSTKA